MRSCEKDLHEIIAAKGHTTTFNMFMSTSEYWILVIGTTQDWSPFICNISLQAVWNQLSSYFRWLHTKLAGMSSIMLECLQWPTKWWGLTFNMHWQLFPARRQLKGPIYIALLKTIQILISQRIWKVNKKIWKCRNTIKNPKTSLSYWLIKIPICCM